MWAKGQRTHRGEKKTHKCLIIRRKNITSWEMQLKQKRDTWFYLPGDKKTNNPKTTITKTHAFFITLSDGKIA